MAIIKTDGGYNALPISYKRGNPIPLDTTAVWYDLDELKAYAASGVTAYVGQILAYVDTENDVSTAYIIADEAGNLKEVGSATAGDSKSIQLNNGVLSLKNFGSKYFALKRDSEGNVITPVEYEEKTGFVAGLELKIAFDGTDYYLAYYEPNTTTAEGITSTVSSLQTTVNAHTDALALLNNTASVEGSIAHTATRIAAEEVAKIVGGADESYNTLKEIADWILNDTTGAADMANDIASLQGLVGSESVAIQISNALKTALEIEGVDKFALASDLTALAGRVTSLESIVGKAADGEHAATGLVKEAADAKAAIQTLNADAQTPGSVDYKIKEVVGNADYAPTEHTHTTTDITDFQTKIEEVVTPLNERLGVLEGKSTLADYGLEDDVYNKTETDEKISEIIKTESGYDVANGTIKAQAEAAMDSKIAVAATNYATKGELAGHEAATVAEDSFEKIHLSAADREKWDGVITAAATAQEEIDALELVVAKNDVNTIASAGNTLKITNTDKAVNIDLVWGSFPTN